MHAEQSKGSRKRVIIVGGGFAGLNAAKLLGRKGKNLDIVVIDRRNHHLFQPLLYQVAMAGLSPADIAAPIRALVGQFRNVSVIQGEVKSIDLANKKLTGDWGDESYDYLVLGTGAMHAYFGHEEWEQFAPGLKTLEQATEIRRRVLMAFERAEADHEDPAERKRLLTFVIVGGGPTGVELAGAIGEMSRTTLAKDFRNIDPKVTRVILIESGNRVMAAFHEDLASRATRDLESLGVQVWTNSMVTGIDENGVDVGEERIEARTVLWAAGVRAGEFGQLDVQRDRIRRIHVGPDLSLPNHPEVFVAGDLAHAEDEKGQPYPGLAPVAMQQGRFVGRAILNEGRRQAARHLQVCRQGSDGHDRPSARDRADRLAALRWAARVVDLVARAHLLPHWVSQPRARVDSVGVVVLDLRSWGSVDRRQELALVPAARAQAGRAHSREPSPRCATSREPAMNRWLCVALTLWAWLPASAQAHALEPRTPVDWSGAPCFTVIDRSTDGAIYPLHYSIPFEDTMLTANEPPDGRRHQFFAFCRDHHFEDVQPNWITQADLDVAVDLGLGLYEGIDPELHILDQALRWQDCFMRITADDDRRPITFEAAAQPIAWDTSSLSPGTYVVEGYTWDPWFNIWSEHPGVFRIVDDPTAVHPPAAAFTFEETSIYVDDEFSVTGCVDAAPGSTMDFAWALGGAGAEPEWQDFAVDVPVRNGEFALPFIGPEPAIGHYLLVRVVVEDSLDRVWTAYSSEYIGVIGKPPPPSDSGDESEGGANDSGEESGEAESDETGEPSVSEAADGCACNFDGGSCSLAPWLLLVVVVAPVRRHARRRA